MRSDILYWRRRAELLNRQLHQGDNVPISRIIRLYKQAFEAIGEDIRKIETARDTVIKSETEKRDLANIALSAPDAVRQNNALKTMEAYNFRIDRAEQVKMRAYTHLMKLVGRAAEIIKPYLKNAYLASKYGTIDDAAKGLNCGIEFSLVPERTLEKVLSAPFHGKNYSQRIWDNTAEAAGKAQKIITKGLARGESYPHMARELQKVTQNTYYNAYRLIQTETTHFTEVGRFDAYKDMGIDKYTYYATLGSKTCDVCAALDGKTFNIDEGVEGKNKPPIHPHCMCYTVIGDVKLTSRLARDPETGKNYKVRGDMTYKEWYEGLPQEKKTAIKAYRNRSADMAQYSRYTERLGKENMPKTLELFQKMKYNDSEKWGDYKYYYRNIDGRPIEYVKIDRELTKLGITNKGKAYPTEQLKITEWSAHSQKRMAQDGVSKDDAVSFYNEAIAIMKKYPNPETQYNYYHNNGITGIRKRDGVVNTVIGKVRFGEDTEKILEVMNKWLS